jgi:hypothetical protein
MQVGTRRSIDEYSIRSHGVDVRRVPAHLRDIRDGGSQPDGRGVSAGGSGGAHYRAREANRAGQDGG